MFGSIYDVSKQGMALAPEGAGPASGVVNVAGVAPAAEEGADNNSSGAVSAAAAQPAAIDTDGLAASLAATISTTIKNSSVCAVLTRTNNCCFSFRMHHGREQHLCLSSRLQ